MILQLFVCASTGRPFLDIPIPKLNGYYLALKDSKNRLIDRINKVKTGLGVDLEHEDGSRIRTECSPISEGGLAQVRNMLERGYKLVVIDTFSRFLGRGDQMDQQEMTRVSGALGRLAFHYHAAIVLIDHHRKSARVSLDADPIDDIMGATGKAAVLDCALGLYRRHKEDDATLKLSGRDFGDSEIALEWNPKTFPWVRKEAKTGRKVFEWTLRERVALDAVAELGHATLSQLVAHLGSDKSNLYNRLQSLCSRGALQCERGLRGCEYTLPSPAPADTTTTTTTTALPGSDGLPGCPRSHPPGPSQ